MSGAVEYSIAVAVIEQLEADQAVMALFGGAWAQFNQSGVAKLFTDLVDQVPPPYCLIEEVGETYQFMSESTQGPSGETAIPFTSPGQMAFTIFAQDRGSCRQLGFAIAKSLNDAPLSWPVGENTMLFRMNKSWFIEMTAPSGPNVPVLFCRKFLFDYEYNATLENF
jgi:hypothetical protein